MGLTGYFGTRDQGLRIRGLDLGFREAWAQVYTYPRTSRIGQTP